MNKIEFELFLPSYHTAELWSFYSDPWHQQDIFIPLIGYFLVFRPFFVNPREFVLM